MIYCGHCGRCHGVAQSCEDARERREELKREVEHHSLHCVGCPDPRAHVLNLHPQQGRRDFLVGAAV